MAQLAYYAWFETALGRVCLAATPKGLVMLQWDTGRNQVRLELRRRFPGLDWLENEDALQKLAKELNDFLKGRCGDFHPPVDVKGTDFQNAVWKALRHIPLGRTVSYQELARKAGRPRAVRAAAGACGRNPVAVAIPCHRVIRADGSLGGFSSGLWRKRFLLKREGSLE